ncbi:unnamed protein product, partial [Durusdinium trenchii]
MSEMASLGQAVEPLVERVARRDLEDRGDDPGSPKKKQKSGARQAKRGPEADIEELDAQKKGNVQKTVDLFTAKSFSTSPRGRIASWIRNSPGDQARRRKSLGLEQGSQRLQECKQRLRTSVRAYRAQMDAGAEPVPDAAPVIDEEQEVFDDLPSLVRLIDISRAHFYGQAQREVFATLPEGDQEEGKVRLLLKSVYGTRDATILYRRRPAAWPAISLREKLEARLLVHGDDFVILGDAAQQHVERALQAEYDLRVDGSIDVGEAKQEFCSLNRLVRFDERTGTIFYEPGPRHAETAEALANHRISQRDSLTMRAAFLAQERPDLSETAKRLARKMQ